MEYSENYKILLVDDEPENIKHLFEVLNSDIYNLIVATNGQQAIDLALAQHPDAIIMDWDMPEVDGIMATKVIRATPETKDIPIIMATGKMTSIKNLSAALENGANDYIRKPFDAIEIKARIHSMIRLRTEQQQKLRFEKEILQQKLDSSKRELHLKLQALAAFKARIIYNSQYFEKIISELQSINENIAGAPKKDIQNLISNLQTDTKKGNWTEFENHFEKIHPSFVETLRKQFPDLSQNEITQCMFYKLNMTTNEIATMTHKTDDTLKKARQRLRKKLGIAQDISLYNFIGEIE